MRIHTLLTLRRFNNFLTAVVIIFAAYILAMPYIPAMTWWMAHTAPLISKPATVAMPHAAADLPAEPTLVIPALGMRETLHDSNSEYILNLGIWHLPGSSNPSTGGNTVLAAHRYTLHGPGVFYHLDLMKPGDNIYVYWNKKQYDYTVRTVSVVPPTEVSVAAPTTDSRLTLYTCTPLWTFKDRLVVVAVPKKGAS